MPNRERRKHTTPHPLPDEDLLEISARAAKTAAFTIGQTEELIRQFRKRKKKP